MLKLFEKYKTFIFLALIISFVLVNIIVIKKEPKIVEKQEVIKKEETANNFKRIKVDVKGCVKAPGVYEFLNYQRIIDAINRAGGLTDNADTSNINLSKILKDEMVVYVYSKEEIINKKVVTKIDDNNDKIDSEIIENYPEKEINNSKISINNASLEQLMTLPKIGKSKAQAIIDYRKKTRFNKLEDLLDVSGIGDSTFELLKDKITL